MKLTQQTILALAMASFTHATSFFTSGELDFGVIIEDGNFEFEAHIINGTLGGTFIDEIEQEIDFTVLVPGSREITTPASFANAGGTAASGVAAGDSLYFLSQDLTVVGSPLPALATEELNAADFQGQSITFSLGAVTLPSADAVFSTWLNDELGTPDFIFSTEGDAVTGNNNTFDSPFGDEGHTHINWGFTEEGEYSIELIAEGVFADGSVALTSTTLNFLVVPEPSSSILVGLSALGLLARRRR